MTAENSRVAMTLSEEQGQALVCLARSVIARRLAVDDVSVCAAEVLAQPALQLRRGVFVTLTVGGQLRGCIGSLIATGSIVDGVRDNAVNAAFHDPRFAPLQQDEFVLIDIEVSVLTDPAPLAHDDGDDLIAKLRPGIDGVIIAKGGHRATFLPQVWKQLPDPDSFLTHLCQKAMLPGGTWRDGSLAVQTYAVQYFHERRENV